jgi:hypothetical protein
MKSTRLTICCAVLLVAALMARSAAAQGTAEQRSACMGDAFEFCGSEIPDATKVEACLRKNLRKISPACQSQFRPANALAKRRITPVAARPVDMHPVY